MPPSNSKKRRRLPSDESDWMPLEERIYRGAPQERDPKLVDMYEKHFHQSVRKPVLDQGGIQKFYWSESIRLYDYANRHASYRHNPCDKIHVACSFACLMDETKATGKIVGTQTPSCPSNGMLCQDMINYQLIDDFLNN